MQFRLKVFQVENARCWVSLVMVPVQCSERFLRVEEELKNLATAGQQEDSSSQVLLLPTSTDLAMSADKLELYLAEEIHPAGFEDTQQYLGVEQEEGK